VLKKEERKASQKPNYVSSERTFSKLSGTLLQSSNFQSVEINWTKSVILILSKNKYPLVIHQASIMTQIVQISLKTLLAEIVKLNLAVFIKKIVELHTQAQMLK